MTKKTTFYDIFLREITQVKCKIGLWFVSSALPLIYIYLCTKYIFNPFCTFKDVAQTGIHYKTQWLSGDNSVNIQGRIMVLVHGTFCNCHLSLNKVSFQFLSYLTRYGPDFREHKDVNSYSIYSPVIM